jgi:hypothetical protein
MPTEPPADRDHPASSWNKTASRLRLASQAMRGLSAGYAAWTLWQMLRWWLDEARVMRFMGQYLERDLRAMESWQRMAALGLDLLAWSLLLAAVVCCWKFLGSLRGGAGFSLGGARQLTRCAWLAMACEVLSLFSRPLQSWLLTLHLPAAEQALRWRFQSADLQTFILCLALLMFAHLFIWAIDVAEENRGFV